MTLHYIKMEARTLHVTVFTDPMEAMETVRTLIAGNDPEIGAFQFTVEGIHEGDGWLRGGKPA
jgi:hypothetical protein